MKLNIDKLRSLRKEKKIPQKKISDSLGFKTPGGYHRIETGENKLKAEHLPVLAEVFQMELNELINHIFFENKLDESSSSFEQLA